MTTLDLSIWVLNLGWEPHYVFMKIVSYPVKYLCTRFEEEIYSLELFGDVFERVFRSWREIR